MFNSALKLNATEEEEGGRSSLPVVERRSLIADEIDALNIPVREYTAKGMRSEIYFILHTQFKNSMPFIPLERGGNRRLINVFSLGQYTLRARDEFSITCDTLLYLNLRLYTTPSIDNITVLDRRSDEDILELPLINLGKIESQFGVQRKRRDTLGRTVIQFPFSIDDNTVDHVLSVIETVQCAVVIPSSL